MSEAREQPRVGQQKYSHCFRTLYRPDSFCLLHYEELPSIWSRTDKYITWSFEPDREAGGSHVTDYRETWPKLEIWVARKVWELPTERQSRMVDQVQVMLSSEEGLNVAKLKQKRHALQTKTDLRNWTRRLWRWFLRTDSKKLSKPT